jgi:hypothetical protein
MTRAWVRKGAGGGRDALQYGVEGLRIGIGGHELVVQPLALGQGRHPDQSLQQLRVLLVAIIEAQSQTAQTAALQQRHRCLVVGDHGFIQSDPLLQAPPDIGVDPHRQPQPGGDLQHLQQRATRCNHLPTADVQAGAQQMELHRLLQQRADQCGIQH